MSIKVVMNKENDKNMIMNNLINLKDQECFRGMSVTADYTVAERQMIKELADKAKERNNRTCELQICVCQGYTKNRVTIEEDPETSAGDKL